MTPIVVTCGPSKIWKKNPHLPTTGKKIRDFTRQRIANVGDPRLSCRDRSVRPAPCLRLHNEAAKKAPTLQSHPVPRQRPFHLSKTSSIQSESHFSHSVFWCYFAADRCAESCASEGTIKCGTCGKALQNWRSNLQEGMFSYISPEKRVPAEHPLRPIRKMVD